MDEVQFEDMRPEKGFHFNIPPAPPPNNVKAELHALAARLAAGHSPQEAHKSTATMMAANGHHLASRIHNIIAMGHENGAYSKKLSPFSGAKVGKSDSSLTRKEYDHEGRHAGPPIFHYNPSGKLGTETYTYHTDPGHPDAPYHPGPGWAINLPQSMGGRSMSIDQPPEHLHKQIGKHLDKHEDYVLERANKPVKSEPEPGKAKEDYPVAEKAAGGKKGR